MNRIVAICLIILLSAITIVSANCQGSFGNLNFESANIPPGTQPNAIIPATNAIPDWSATTLVGYDFFSTGGAIISIFDTNFGFGIAPLQGQYSVFLFGGEGGPTTLSQTGLVPAGTESLLMDLAGSGVPLLIVSLGGQTIQLSPLETFPGYTVYGATISAGFAGLPEELSFTEQPPVGVPPSFLELDNIIFSTLAVPEPGTCGLILCGAVLFGLNCWRKR